MELLEMLLDRDGLTEAHREAIVRAVTQELSAAEALQLVVAVALHPT